MEKPYTIEATANTADVGFYTFAPITYVEDVARHVLEQVKQQYPWMDIELRLPDGTTERLELND